MKKLILIFFLFFTLNVFAQTIVCDNAAVADAYKLALLTVDINTRRGVLAAGADYGGEWTRDISINSWNGVSMLRPKVAEQSLWSVTDNKDKIGHQYWDKIIWVIAAYNHYQVTGDKNFLKQAFKCSNNTMKELELLIFDKNYGLFMGPSVFNDGIAAYPEPIYEPLNFSSSVLDHRSSSKIKCLSTNCVYYGAYIELNQMSKLLNKNDKRSDLYMSKAEKLKSSILKNFYNSEKNNFYYLIDHQGIINNSQEALGISFAVIFGIIEGEKANHLIRDAVVSKYGITSIFPDLPRYSKEKPGRHNNIIWPMVSGFFAKASIDANNFESFSFELNNLIHLALDENKGNYDFREVYNPYSGLPDGGYQHNGQEQPDYHWESCKLQTWSATAYINMIQYGLAGMRNLNDGLLFSPFLPNNIHHLEIHDFKYRNSTLNIVLNGNGKKIKTFLLNGNKQTSNKIDTRISGVNRIVIELE